MPSFGGVAAELTPRAMSLGENLPHRVTAAAIAITAEYVTMLRAISPRRRDDPCLLLRAPTGLKTDNATSNTMTMRAAKPGTTAKPKTGSKTAAAAIVDTPWDAAPGEAAGTPVSLAAFFSPRLGRACLCRSGEGGAPGEPGGGSRRCGLVANRGLDEAALPPGLRLPDETRLWRTSHELPCMVPGMGVTTGSSLMRSECRYSWAESGLVPLSRESAEPSSLAARVMRSSAESRNRVSASEIGRRVAR